MSMIIPEIYQEIEHRILKEKCPVCEEQFKVGDSIEMVPIQKSKDDKEFNSIAVIVHTECYWV